MKAYATQRGKPLVVFLVPTVNSPDLMRKRFDGADKAVTELGLPVIDVLDTFAAVEELEPLRAAHLDFHPNGPGHRMVFESLYTALLRDRAAWIALTGAAAEPRAKPGR